MALAEIPTAESVRRSIAQGEGQRLELKQRIPIPALLAQLIGSFANSQGGTIVVGVREPNQIVGCNYATLSEVFDRANEQLSPVPGSQLHHVYVDGVDVGVIQVPHSERLVVASAGAFVRDGERTRAMSPAEIEARLVQPATAPTPSEIARAIAANTETIASNTETIDRLRASLERAQSIRGQWPGYLIGFILGIAASLIASFIYAWTVAPTT